MKAKAIWLNRVLIDCPYYTLATSQDILDIELKRLKIKGGVIVIVNVTIMKLAN